MKKSLFLLLAVGLLVAALLVPQSAPVIVGVACLGAIIWLVADVSRGFRRSQLVTAFNTLPKNQGATVNARRFRATAALATRKVFVKQGADDEHIAAIAATSDKPLGVIDDEAPDAESPITVEMAGLSNRTVQVLAGAAIAALNQDMYLTAAGKIVIKPTAAGTYWKVGRNHTLADAANDPVEMTMCEPRKLIVLAALTNVASDIADTNSTAVNPTKADFDSLLVAAGKLQADFLLLAAAVKDGADIDYATT